MYTFSPFGFEITDVSMIETTIYQIEDLSIEPDGKVKVSEGDTVETTESKPTPHHGDELTQSGEYSFGDENGNECSERDLILSNYDFAIRNFTRDPDYALTYQRGNPIGDEERLGGLYICFGTYCHGERKRVYGTKTGWLGPYSTLIEISDEFDLDLDELKDWEIPNPLSKGHIVKIEDDEPMGVIDGATGKILIA